MSEGGDVGILNFALTLEYLESAFYDEAKKRAKRERRTEEPDRPARRRRAAARRSADRDDQAARRQAGRRTEVRLPLQRHGRLPEAGADLRGHRGQRLQRRRARRSSRKTCSARPARSSRSRPVTRRRSGSRTSQEPSPEAFDPPLDEATGAEGCGTVHRVKPERLADEELMPLIAAQDPDALEVVYDRHGGVAYSLAYRIVGERAAAEDVIQEAFISIWRSGARYDRARGSVRSWMLGDRPQPGDRPAAQQDRPGAQLDFDDDTILEQRAGRRADRGGGAASARRRTRSAARSASCRATSRR